MSSVIEARGIVKDYAVGRQTLRVLKGLDFCVEKNGVYAIAGPSGAGKTTFLNILSGMDEPSRGQVFLSGCEFSRLGHDRRQRFLNQKTGFVFQFYHLLADLTALENVMLPGLIHPRVKRAELVSRAAELLKEVGLAERVRHYPSELSGGEQQRVAIARACVNDPDIVFCDEPTGNLDSVTGMTVIRYLENLQRSRNKTVIIVTHDDKIAQRAERIFFLKDGAWEGTRSA